MSIKTNVQVEPEIKIQKKLTKVRLPLVIEQSQIEDPNTKIFGRGKELIPVKFEKPKDCADLKESLTLEPPALSGDRQQTTLWQSLSATFLKSECNLSKPQKEFFSKVKQIISQKESKLGFKLRDKVPDGGDWRPELEPKPEETAQVKAELPPHHLKMTESIKKKVVAAQAPMNDEQHYSELEKLGQANCELGKEVAQSKLLIKRIKREKFTSELGFAPQKTRNGILGPKYASSFFLTQKPSALLKKSTITSEDTPPIVQTPKRVTKKMRPP